MGLFSGASAGVKLDADSTGYRREVKRAARETKKEFGELKKQTAGLRNAFKGLALGLGAGLAAGIGVVAKAGISELGEMQTATAQTNAVIKSTGSAARVTAAQVTQLAGAISAKSGIDDQAIQSGQNMLLTFTNIRNEAGKGRDIFNQATQTVTDLAVAMGTEPKQAAMQLGKALNDPAKGITKLTRIGVTFTEAQKKQIEAMSAAGDTAGAQKVILAELNKEFGGSAAAFGTTMPGQIAKAKNAFADMSATIVAAFVPAFTAGLGKVNEWIARMQAWARTPDGRRTLTAMADGARRVAGALQTAGSWVLRITKFLIDHRAVVVPVTATLLAMVAAYKAFVVISTAVRLVKALTAGQIALNVAMIANPVGLVVAAIVGLGVALVIAYKKSDTFRGIVQAVWGWIKKLAASVWNAKEYLLLLGGPAGALVLAYKKSETFRDAVKSVWSWLKKMGSEISEKVLGAIDTLRDAMEKLRKKLKPVADFVGKIAGGLGKIAGAAGGAAGAISGAFGDDWDGLGGLGLMGSSALPPGVKASLGPFAAMARGQGLTLTSGHRPGAITADGNPSDHGTGNAIDVAGHPMAMARVARLANLLPRVKQVIYTPVGISNNGGPFSPVPPGATRQGHYDHVHIAAYQRGGRVPGGPHLIGDRVPAILEPGEFVLNKKAVGAFEAVHGPLEGWNGMARGGRVRRPVRRPTVAQRVTAAVTAAGTRANIAADPLLGQQQAERQLRAAAQQARAAQLRIDAEKRTIAQLERQQKSAKKGSAERKRIDTELAKHRKALAANTTKFKDATSAQAQYADSVVSLRQQVEEQRAAEAEAARQAEEERQRAAEEAARAVQDQARAAADSAFSYADAEANLAAARAEATAALDDDVAVAQRMLELAAGRAAAIETQLGRGDLTAETRTDLVNQLADATRAQTTLRDRVRELNETMTPAAGSTGVTIDPAQLQQLIASNDAFLAGLRETLRNERSNITIAPTFTQPQTGVNQFLETMRYKLTQVGAGGAL